MTKNSGARIILVDDHPAVRQGLALLLARDHHQVCGEAGSRAEALRLSTFAAADMVLLDLSLGEESGLSLLDDFCRQGIPVLIYSMHEDTGTIRQAFARGALGYVCKREASRVLLDAVREVLGGRCYLSPFVSEKMAGGSPAAATAVRTPPADGALSEREGQIIELLGQGCGNQEIAEQLALSVRTVESYCARAIEKLSLAGMKDLRRYAIQQQRRTDAGDAQ
ncbi:response regulator transcription factor [Rhodocyclus tenuis]|uniref:response regulator transcription factor n=1 Tax=Rhodocyclus tenuis TaxID=1066 RepID=UPI001904DCCD|nr:response regulator transcription factor [Rhodocyclus tenuis]MBK1680749.1 hypothetical protein [Rhodocyclus tenuis]